MKSRCGSNKISELIAVNNVRSSAADEAERRVLIDQLKKFRSAMQENEALDLSKTSDWGIRLWPESSFGRLQKPASEMLGELTKLMSSTLYSRVTSSGELHVYLLEEGWVDVTHNVKYNAEAIVKVERIAAIAMDLGGFVYSDNTVLLSQWLSFHGFNVPDDGTKLDSLIGFLEWKWPETDNFANYWEQITGFNDASIALTPLQCAEIRALTGKKIPAGESLLGSLFKRVKPYNSVTVDWSSANEVIAILVRHPTSQQLAREYVEALGWWGAAESQKVDEDDLAQVLLTAIVLQSDPSIGTGGKRNCIGRFDIYDPGSTADRPLYTLRENFEAYLVATGHSHSIVPLISHLLLAHVAPGLLVKNLPAELYVGSIGVGDFCPSGKFCRDQSKRELSLHVL
jgi:hypothetical protein